MHRQRPNHIGRLIVVLATLAALPAASAGVRVKDICRVKGQETNTLQGLGLVVGLNGTGDGGDFLPTIGTLSTLLTAMNSPVGDLQQLRKADNVAVVMVMATVPASGAREGDQIDCVVSSIGGAKSLAAGQLLLTAMMGPQPQGANPTVYAVSAGPVELDDPNLPTRGRVHKGCRMEAELFNPFIKDNRITLVLDEHRADFETALAVADAINNRSSVRDKRDGGATDDAILARAIDRRNVEVIVPTAYYPDPVDFVALILSQELFDVATPARVTINSHTGRIIIGADVEIGPAIIAHKDLVIETGAGVNTGRFVPLDTQGAQSARLEALVEALNAVKVPTEDMIDIIRGLERNGKLNGWLEIE